MNTIITQGSELVTTTAAQEARKLRDELLAKAAPYLVTMTENVAALKSALKGLQPGKNLPGVKHWTEAVTITRG